MKHYIFIFCLIFSVPAYAEKSAFPIPADVSEIVTWTHLCEKWMMAENESSRERIDATPALSWARANCSHEELEAKIIYLQEKYKSDPIISYTLDNLIGAYKD